MNGLFLGIVVDVDDPDGLNRIKVDVGSFYGGTRDGGQGAVWCRQMASSGGTTAPRKAAGGRGQSTFGVFFQPPGVGNEVMVAFTGDRHAGIVVGVLPDIHKMGDAAGAGEFRRTSEGRMEMAMQVSTEAGSIDDDPPPHPQSEFVRKQGLASDGLRGQNRSSPRRKATSHSRVAGISTPDGHAITLDDGEREGDAGNVRIRTRAGNQIYMDDEHGFIYVVTRDGSWIEINSRGDVDVYGKGSVNFATPGNFNVHCGGRFSVNANGGINMTGKGDGVKVAAAAGKMHLYGQDGMNQESGASFGVRAAASYAETAARIDMNGPPAPEAEKPRENPLSENRSVLSSVATRVPEAEPWAGHPDRMDAPSGGGAGTQGSAQGAGTQGPPAGSFADAGGTGGQGGADAGYAPSGGARGVNIGDYAEESILPEARSDDYIDWAAGVDRRVDPDLLEIVRRVSKRFGRRLTVTSGFRDPGRNRKAGGSKRSQHLLGKAVDISGKGMSNADKLELIGIASSEGIRGIGVYEDSGSLHFDLRDTARAGWGGDFSESSVPEWAASAVDRHKSGGYA